MFSVAVRMSETDALTAFGLKGFFVNLTLTTHCSLSAISEDVLKNRIGLIRTLLSLS